MDDVIFAHNCRRIGDPKRAYAQRDSKTRDSTGRYVHWVVVVVVVVVKVLTTKLLVW